jgi:hypothetical protein
MHKNRGVKMRQLDDGIGDTLVLALKELPPQELIELAKRVQIPGYEAVYEMVQCRQRRSHD